MTAFEWPQLLNALKRVNANSSPFTLKCTLSQYGNEFWLYDHKERQELFEVIKTLHMKIVFYDMFRGFECCQLIQ